MTVTPCEWCGREIDGGRMVGLLRPKEVGPGKYACSAACIEALADAYCGTCGSWIPDGDHAADCPAVDPHERMLDAQWEEGHHESD